MTTASSTTAEARAAHSALSALADTLASESRLLQELGDGLLRQREAVARDDLQTIEETVYATHRILTTLAEARRRRRSLDEMMQNLRVDVTPEIQDAYALLHATALTLSAEVETTRQVLGHALRSSEEQIQVLYTSAAPAAFYDNPATPLAPAAGVEGSLFNRRA
jgi:hypothetical protein